MSTRARVTAAGDGCFILTLPPQVHGAATDAGRTAAAADAIRAAAFPGVIDVVPTYQSVGVYVDPVRAGAGLEHALVQVLNEALPPLPQAHERTVDVPVCYGGEFGPDLAEVADFARCTAESVVEMHCRPVYRVQMLGFAPGFAYMSEVSKEIAMPRKGSPRVRVPAGSVALAATQTGVYPFDMPGGWQIVGRTPLRVTDFERASPFLFQPGDRVRFQPIDADTFDRLARAQENL